MVSKAARSCSLWSAIAVLSLAQPLHAIDQILASDGQPGDRFGIAIAFDGTVALIGAESDDDWGDRSGAAYFFEMAGGSFVERQKLHALDAAGDAGFGVAVALQGSVCAIGAWLDDEAGQNAGAAYIFNYDGKSWQQQEKLIAVQTVADDRFGWYLALNGDVLVIGAPFAGSVEQGAAYVFRNMNGTWEQEAELLSWNPTDRQRFGSGCAVAGEVLAIVAAAFDNDEDAAYVFRRVGGQWLQEQELIGSVPNNSAHSTIVISGDRIYSGSSRNSTPGVVDVHQFDGASWSLQQSFTADPAVAGDNFGSCTSVVGDSAVIGASAANGVYSDTGAVYMFDSDGVLWSQEQQLSPCVLHTDDRFGLRCQHVEGIALISAPNSDLLGENSGSVFVVPLEGPDSDSDGVVDDNDNCPAAANFDQADLDIDCVGDACDDDVDGDGVDNAADNCPVDSNANQADCNENGVGDPCDADTDCCPGVAERDDLDDDCVVNAADNCPADFNPEQSDCNKDGVGDACDDDGECCFTLANCADLDGNNKRDDPCLWYSCNSGECSAVPRGFLNGGQFGQADIGSPFGSCAVDGAADSNDRFHALNCFSNANFDQPGVYPCESNPPQGLNVDGGGPSSCVLDGVCDGNDVGHALNSFANTFYGMPMTYQCTCPPGPAPVPQIDPNEYTGLVLRGPALAGPGDMISVDVFLTGGVKTLTGYQLHLGASGATSGRLELVDITVDSGRRDHVFGELNDGWTAFNRGTSQMVAGMDALEGRPAEAGAYLATFHYRLSSDARGKFVVDVLHDPWLASLEHRTFLFGYYGRPVGVTSVISATIGVTRASDQHAEFMPARRL